jgi:N-acetylmuramoyl-L-alanine amidase
MRINVHAGHTKQNGNAPGASGIVHESVEDRKIKDALIKILRERGHTVYDCTSEGSSARDNLYLIVKKCNAHDVDLDVSIHLNCSNGQGHGTETLIYSSGSKAKSYAKKIDKNIAALGFADRGVKVRSDLYVLHRTNAPALLVETFFCDNKKDCSLYKKVGYKGIAKAIADGIAPAKKKKEPAKKGEPKKETPKKPAKKKSNEEIAKEVIAGKWGNGEARKKKLKAAGYDYDAVQKIVNKLAR